MRKSLLKVVGISAIGFGLVAGVASICGAMTLDVTAEPQMQAQQPAITPVADTVIGSGGIQTWIRLNKLDGRNEAHGPARTLFVPSDDAFSTLPAEELNALLAPQFSDKRRAFLARAATETRITPADLAGKRISITTMDGRPLVIDATGEGVMVGDAEALDVQLLPDGRVLFVLDHLP